MALASPTFAPAAQKNPARYACWCYLNTAPGQAPPSRSQEVVTAPGTVGRWTNTITKESLSDTVGQLSDCWTVGPSENCRTLSDTTVGLSDRGSSLTSQPGLAQAYIFFGGWGDFFHLFLSDCPWNLGIFLEILTGNGRLVTVVTVNCNGCNGYGL